MSDVSDATGAFALELLKLFPPILRTDVAEQTDFRLHFGLSVDSTISFGKSGVSLRRSVFYPAARALYRKTQPSVTIQTADGQNAVLTLHDKAKPELSISIGERCEQIPSFWMLSDDRDVRMSMFEKEVGSRNLPSSTIGRWRQKIEERSLSDDEIGEFIEELRLIPQDVAAAIREEFFKTEGAVSVLVPRTPSYYRGLIGDRGDAANVVEYATDTARSQIERLLKWDFERGLAQSLLFCANPGLSALVDISGRPAKEIMAFFSWLAADGDRFSQIAGIEIGIRFVTEYPDLEPTIVKLIEEIRDEDTGSDESRLALTANLFVFVDGELARTRTLADAPPFWRRLAATAQSSMIERTLVSLGGTGEDSTEWAMLRGQKFFMQTLADLRQEPRWNPDLMTAKQLQVELLTRARIAGAEMREMLPDGPLRALLFGKGANQLESLTSVPSAYAPSPVEGGIESPRPFPEDLLADLRARKVDGPLEEKVFASVVNFAQVFRFDHEIAGYIVELLRKAKYRLSLRPDGDVAFTIVMGLASIAASARHTELADEIRILARVLKHRKDLSANSETHMRIALFACASRSNLEEWCQVVGDWLFEIANWDIDAGEAAVFRSNLRQLCHSVPELWPHLSKADAALAAIRS